MSFSARWLCLLTLLCFISFFTTSCSLQYSRPEIVSTHPESNSSIGLNQLLEINHDINLVFVHGMCTVDESWSAITQKFVQELYKESPSNYVESGVYSFGKTNLYFAKLNLTNQKSINVYSIIWSGETTEAKKELCYDRNLDKFDQADTKYCNHNELRDNYHFKRASGNNYLKSYLMNDCLADVLAYVEPTTHSQINTNVAEAIKRIVGSNPLGNISNIQKTPTVIITSSLGSKVLFDTLRMMLDNESTKSYAISFGGDIKQIHMNANQLPILSLAIEKNGTFIDQSYSDSMIQFFEMIKNDPDKITDKIQINAYSDPNDLLSYPLTGSKQGKLIDQSDTLSYVDVITSNDYTWFGLFENPLSAHTAYLKNSSIRTIIKCGLLVGSDCK